MKINYDRIIEDIRIIQEKDKTINDPLKSIRLAGKVYDIIDNHKSIAQANQFIVDIKNNKGSEATIKFLEKLIKKNEKKLADIRKEVQSM
jgi:hypothetical protein